MFLPFPTHSAATLASFKQAPRTSIDTIKKSIRVSLYRHTRQRRRRYKVRLKIGDQGQSWHLPPTSPNSVDSHRTLHNMLSGSSSSTTTTSSTTTPATTPATIPATAASGSSRADHHTTTSSSTNPPQPRHARPRLFFLCPARPPTQHCTKDPSRPTPFAQQRKQHREAPTETPSYLLHPSR